jgi:5-formyltetrahydrofolate cyclo-ligase
MSALSPRYVGLSDAGIAREVVSMPEYLSAETVLLFYGTAGEVNTLPIIEDALSKRKTVCLPESLPGGIMHARRILSLLGLLGGRFGIPAPRRGAELVPPERLGFILVPGLTFDRAGYRLGRGGGYYDRYLPQTRAYTAGVCREELLCDAVPREAHDAPVACVVTETGARRYM